MQWKLGELTSRATMCLKATLAQINNDGECGLEKHSAVHAEVRGVICESADARAGAGRKPCRLSLASMRQKELIPHIFTL